MNFIELIDKYYLPGTRVREILLKHSRQVADKALAIAEAQNLPLDRGQIEAGAMLHDIGIIKTDADGIDCHGTEPYLRHGILGAEILRNEGAPEWLARIAERHTGAGITNEDIETMNLPLPKGDYMPETLLEKLVCYADKFYSKSGDMEEKSLERVKASMARHSEATLARFLELHKLFTGDVAV
jgi:uncharacterized protein